MFVVISLSCNPVGSSYEIFFQVVLADTFSQDTVEVQISEAVWFRGVVSTDPADGLAMVGERSWLSSGYHSIYIKVNPDEIELLRTFEVLDDSYVRISFERDSRNIKVAFTPGSLNRYPRL